MATQAPTTSGNWRSDGEFVIIPQPGYDSNAVHISVPFEPAGRERNARLMANAEAMYEALKRLWGAVLPYDTIGHEGSELLEAMSEARESIEKAEGR